MFRDDQFDIRHSPMFNDANSDYLNNACVNTLHFYLHCQNQEIVTAVLNVSHAIMHCLEEEEGENGVVYDGIQHTCHCNIR